MTCLRPATPGFIVTLIATVLLAVVVFSVPFFKSVYFLKASINYQGVSGNITFGTLGYCVELDTNTTCSKPSVGYELDINGLVGNSLPVKIPTIVVKWITYILVLHVVALGFAAGSAVFGLLAHVREMAMTCCSTCISGFGAVVTLIALIFDIVLFFVAKSRINSIGHAQIGNAIWLTLGAWALLLFSGCFYTLGRCCMKGRPGTSNGGSGNWFKRGGESGPDKYADQMRLDAVKAEADRKARQKQGEVGLPAFYETQPLTGHVEGDQVHFEGGDNQSTFDPTPPSTTNFKGGYAPGPAGSRTVDAFYHRNNSSSTLYPPHEVRRQRSEYSTPTTTSSPPISYTTPSGYGQYSNAPVSMSPPPNNQLLVPSGHQPYNNDPYGREYGHTAGGTSYHTAISHDQGPSSYGEPLNNPYTAYQPSRPTYQPDHFVSNTPMPQAITADYYPPISTSPPPLQQPQPLHGDRSYTLGGDGYGTGGDGYGSNQLPPLPNPTSSLPPGAGAPSYLAFGQQHQLPPIDTDVGAGYITGPQFHTSPSPNEAPPVYESNGADAAGNWGKR